MRGLGQAVVVGPERFRTVMPMQRIRISARIPMRTRRSKPPAAITAGRLVNPAAAAAPS